MLEHPVALAIIARSPNSWESSLRYGVSPQPAHAPENSNNGRTSCEPRSESSLTLVLLLAWDYSFLDGGERANRRSRTVSMNRGMAEDVFRSEDLSEMLAKDAVDS